MFIDAARQGRRPCNGGYHGAQRAVHERDASRSSRRSSHRRPRTPPTTAASSNPEWLSPSPVASRRSLARDAGGDLASQVSPRRRPRCRRHRQRRRQVSFEAPTGCARSTSRSSTPAFSAELQRSVRAPPRWKIREWVPPSGGTHCVYVFEGGSGLHVGRGPARLSRRFGKTHLRCAPPAHANLGERPRMPRSSSPSASRTGLVGRVSGLPAYVAAICSSAPGLRLSRAGPTSHWVVAAQAYDRRVNEGRNRYGEDRARDACDSADPAVITSMTATDAVTPRSTS